MLQIIKNRIQQYMSEKARNKYDEEVNKQRETYLQWIAEQEAPCFDSLFSAAEEVKVQQKTEVIYYEDCGKEFSLEKFDKDYLVFASRQGELRNRAVIAMIGKFESDGRCRIIYGDEDYLDKDGKRSEPWFKPDWSPDTLLSFFYFGAVFAVRRQAVQDLIWQKSDNFFENIYDFVLKATEMAESKAMESKTIHHMDMVLFHNGFSQGKNDNETVDNAIVLKGADADYNQIKLQAVKRRGLHGKMVSGGIGNPYYTVVYEPEPEPRVSIIIPSKDNSEVLGKCLKSIKNNTTYNNYELIIIDNGSDAFHRAALEAMQEIFQFTYLYQPMEFNFSKMCNYAVSYSQGEYILLLNDDCEVIQKDWLKRMLGQASLRHVGAVGAKLLYPMNNLIQHAGITNLVVGPAHKLVGLTDEVVYYHGQNRLVYDMIGVTAACLLVAKEKYEMVSGFNEELEVAYNDVDFCFSLQEQGFYNVQRNDVVLCHHESLSRGDDGEDEAKWIRLLSEKDVLYARHPQFYQYDPYYSKHLAGNAREYRCNYIYDFENRYCYSKPKKCHVNIEPYLNNCFQVHVEYIKLEQKLETKDPDVYLIEGWSYIMGVDNSHYKRNIVLTGDDGRQWCISVLNRYRKDVAVTFTEEVNTALSGFVCRIPVGLLDKGNYTIALLAKDTCSRQKLCAKAETKLRVWK